MSLRQETFDAPEIAFAELQHERYAESYYFRSKTFLMEYILSNQSPEKLKEMGYTVQQRHVLLQKRQEDLHTFAYAEWETYTRAARQFPSAKLSGARKWVDVCEDAAGAIFEECSKSRQEGQEETWKVPRLSLPEKLQGLEASDDQLAAVYSYFE